MRTHRTAPRATEAGVTLVELLTVVVIIGVMAGGASLWMRTDQTAGSARSASSIMQEARRVAVAHGPIRPDVAAATGLRATGRVALMRGAVAGEPDVIEVYELIEDPSAATAAWSLVNSISLPDEVELAGFTTSAASVPNNITPTLIPPGQPRQILYYPDGSSDAATVWLRSKKAGGDRYRIFVMPLAGIAAVGRDW